MLSCCIPLRPPLRLSLCVRVEVLAIWGYILPICGAKQDLISLVQRCIQVDADEELSVVSVNQK